MSTPNPFSQPNFCPTHAIVPVIKHVLVVALAGWLCCCILQDHAFAGICAGTIAVICINPLNLLKVKFQVSTRAPEGGIGRGIWRALPDIHASEGLRGLYRGLGPNVAAFMKSPNLFGCC